MEKYLKLLINDCIKAKNKGEIPVAALIIDQNGKIISREINNRESKHKVTGHAEILSIDKATKKINDWRLNNYEMIVTLFPCKMCREVINESRIKKVYYLLDSDEKNKNEEKYIKIINNKQKEKYKEILKSFFVNIR